MHYPIDAKTKKPYGMPVEEPKQPEKPIVEDKKGRHK